MPAFFPEQANEKIAFLARISPQSQAAGTVQTGAVAVGDAMRHYFLISMGAMGASGTVDVKLQESILSTGPWVDITDGDLAQLVDGTDDDKDHYIEIAASQLSRNYDYVRAHITVATAASLFGVHHIGFDGHHGPLSDKSTNIGKSKVVSTS